jgi:predicted ribosomally synthesized peptide with SipW-like signal peptide
MNLLMTVFKRAATMQTLTVGVLLAGVLSVQVGHGTMAYFTTQVTSTGNTFSAGNLHFNINDNTDATAGHTTVASSIALTNMKPGDSVYAPILLTNVGSLDAQYGIKYVTTNVSGAGTDLTTHLQMAIVARGSGTGAAADCVNISPAFLFADTGVWTEQIQPTLTGLVVAPVSPIVTSTGATGPVLDGTYDATDAAATAYLPLDHAGTDLLCVRVTFPDAGAPASLVLGDNVFNHATAQTWDATIVFTFDAQQRNHPVEFDQIAGPTVGNF